MSERTESEKDANAEESQALLRLLEESAADVAAGRIRDSEEVFADARRMIAKMREERE